MDWTGLDWMDGSDVILLRRRVLLEHLAVLIRSTRLPDDCDIGNPASIQNTCAQISCLEDIVKKSGACDGGSEKKDCLSLEKVSAALSTVSKQYSCDGEFISPLELLGALSIVMFQKINYKIEYQNVIVTIQCHHHCISGLHNRESPETSQVKDFQHCHS